MSMPHKYAIAITEENLDLIQFLNDGGEVKQEEKDTFFHFEITSPREITTTKDAIQFEDDMYEKGYLKEDVTILM